MVRKKWLASIVALMLVFTLCSFASAEDITYESRGVQVPATVEIPDGDGPFPLVVFAHGHGGSRNENIGFSTIAEALEAEGIASIRMDFSGCGDSTESFQLNTLTNMKEDFMNGLTYATENYNIDTTKIGAFGYSMGGRVVLELLDESAYDFAAVALLAPANSTEDLENLFGGADNWATLKATAEADGYADFTTIYGQEQQLSKEWFEDLDKIADPAATAAENYSGPALVIYSLDDEAVSPSVSAEAAAKLLAEVVHATGDGHSYGFYSDQTEVLNTVVNALTGFFGDELQ
ncbi:MAG: alpha/beta fold hydrolase [Eubacteriales bacterium]|nr:alpha/beta fold hydrolase [Eubacteriales bacterium]